MAAVAEAGSTVIAFDVVVSEPERNPIDDALQRAEQQGYRFSVPEWRDDIDADTQFALSLGLMDTVLGFFFLDQALTNGQLPQPLEQWSKTQADNIIHIAKPGDAANISTLQHSATHAGFVTTFVDGDGVVRRSPLLIAHQQAVYASLSVATVMTYLLADNVDIVTVPIGKHRAIRHISLLDSYIRTDAAGRAIVPYKGGKGSFPYLSAANLLRGDFAAAQLAGAIVLLGTSAQGLADRRTTPWPTQYPGVDVNANLIAGLLHGHFPNRRAW